MLPTTYQSTVLPFVILPATYCHNRSLSVLTLNVIQVWPFNWDRIHPYRWGLIFRIGHNMFLIFCDFLCSRDTMPSLSALSQIGYNVKVCWAHLTRNISPINFPLYTDDTPPSTLVYTSSNLLKSTSQNVAQNKAFNIATVQMSKSIVW